MKQVMHNECVNLLLFRIQRQSGLYKKLESAVTGFSQWIQSPEQEMKVLFGGMIGSWFSLLQFLVAPFVGATSDVFGRKIPLLICLTGVAVSYALWSCSQKSFLLFCVSRTIGGLSKGNVSISTAVVADVSREENRGKGMALIGIAFSIGFIVGPMLGAILSNISHSYSPDHFFAVPAIVALSLAVANILFTGFAFPESLTPEHRVSTLSSSSSSFFSFFSFPYSRGTSSFRSRNTRTTHTG